MGEHEWVPSTLGHGEMQCKHCLMTNREAWVLGTECSCNVACTTPAPIILTEQGVNVVQNTPPIEQAINDRLAEVKTLTFSDAPYERPQGDIRCEDVPDKETPCPECGRLRLHKAFCSVVSEDLRGVTPRTEPELDDVEQVLSRVEVLLDTWALLLDNHPVIEGDDAPDGLHDMSWVAVAAITRLRDELLLRADKLREPNDG